MIQGIIPGQQNLGGRQKRNKSTHTREGEAEWQEFAKPREQFQGGVATPNKDPGNKDLKVSIGFCVKGVFSNPEKDGSRDVVEVNGRGGGDNGECGLLFHKAC